MGKPTSHWPKRSFRRPLTKAGRRRAAVERDVQEMRRRAAQAEVRIAHEDDS